MRFREALKVPIPTYVVMVQLALVGASTATASYFILRRAFSKEADIRITQEVEEVKRFYGVTKKANPVDLVNQLVNSYEDETVDLVLNEAGYAKISDVKEFWPDKVTYEIIHPGHGEPLTEVELNAIDEVQGDLVEVAHNVFTNADVDEEGTEWDYGYEMEHRDLTKPFIIHRDEYGEEEEIDTTCITFYEGDGILADDRNIIIPKPETVVGLENLRWGHGSGDPNVVFIRNPDLECDFEVTRDDGKYTEQVLGYLQHDDEPHHKRRVMKHRVYDD